jgi:hypothetical protein
VRTGHDEAIDPDGWAKEPGGDGDHRVQGEGRGDSGEHPAGAVFGAQHQAGDCALVRRFSDEDQSEDGRDDRGAEHERVVLSVGTASPRH